jgi:hypothetical protein
LVPDVFEEQPPVLAVLLLYETVEVESGQGQVRKDFFIHKAFNIRLGLLAALGDDVRLPDPDLNESVDHPCFPPLQNFDSLGLDSLWPKLTPGLDRRVLEQISP